MINTAYSSHSLKRMQQRGIRQEDIDLVLVCGTQIDSNVYLLRSKDTEREIEQRKREIQALERLRNQKVVVAGDVIVTCYKSQRADLKRTLRNGRERA